MIGFSKTLSQAAKRSALFSAQKCTLHQSSCHRQLPKLQKVSDGEGLRSRAAAIVGEKHASLAEVIRSQHGQDEGPDKGKLPDLVVFPKDVNEVSEVRSNK